VGEVLEEPGERKERWLYLRAALSSTVGIRRGAVAKRKRRRLHAIVRRQEDSLPSGEWHYNATPFLFKIAQSSGGGMIGRC